MRPSLRSLLIAGSAFLASAAVAAPPPAPSGLTASATGLSGKVQLSWSAVTSPAGVSGYLVYTGTSAAFLPGSPQFVSTTSLLKTGLADAVRAYFWVATEHPVDGVGPVGVTVSSMPYQPPDAPIGLGAVMLPYGAGAYLTWSATSGYGQPLGAVRISQSTGASFSQVRSVGPGVTGTSLALPCGVGVSLVARAVDVLGNSSLPSASILVSLPCAPVLQSLSLNAGALSLIWAPAVASASLPQSYGLFSATALSVSAGGLEAVFTGLTLTGTTLAPADGQSRWYRMFSVDAAGTSSAASNAVGLLVPPASLSALASKSRVQLQWTRPAAADARGLTAYQVFMATAAAGIYSSVSIVAENGGASALGLTLSGLADGQSRWFSVASLGGSPTARIGYSSMTVSAVPGLASPVISALNAGSGSTLGLTWTAVDVAGNTPAVYIVHRADDLSFSNLTVLAQTTSTTVGSLSQPVPGSAAYYFVSVSDNAGASSSLSPSSLVFAPALGAPALSSGGVDNGRVQLYWTSVPDAGSYRIYRATAGLTFSAAVFETQDAWTTTGLSFIDTKPVNGSGNVYVVKAERLVAGSLGQLSGPASNSVTLTPLVLPDIPGRFATSSIVTSAFGYITAVARPGGPGVDLSWKASDLGSAVLSRYVVYRGFSASALAQIAFVAASVTAYNDAAAAAPFGALWYGVQAEDMNGQVSEVVSSPVSEVRPWPAPLNLAAAALSGGVRLSWASPTGSGTYPLSGYAVSRRVQSGAPEELLGDVTRTSYTDYSAAAGVGLQPVYSVRLRDVMGGTGSAVSVTVNLSGAAAWASTPTATVLVGTLALTGTAAPQLLSWWPNPQSEAVTAYEVFRGLSSLTVTTGLSWTDGGSTPGSTNSYGVRAFNAYGQGLSNTVSVLLAPPQPSWVSLSSAVDPAASGTAALHLSWEDLGVPTGVDGYVVYRAVPENAVPVALTTTSASSYVDLSPVQGQSAAYSVRGYVGGQTSTALTVAPSFVPAMSLPGSVAGLAALRRSGNLLSWSREAGSREYWVYRDTAALPPYPAFAPLTKTTGLNWDDLAGGTSAPLFYGVQGANALGLGPVTSIAATPFPGLATGLVAAAGYVSPAPQVSLSWSAPSPSFAATGYRIYRSTVSAASLGSPATYLATTASNSYLDAAIPLTNTAVFYLVNSLGLDERISPSPVSATVFDVPALAPQGVSATGASNEVTVRWAPEPASAGISAYQVNYEIAGTLTSTVASLAAGASSYRVAGLPQGTSVDFSVRSLNNGGQAASPWSLTVSAYANAAAGAASPLSAAASVGFRETDPSLSRVRITWAPVGVSNSVAIYRSAGPMLLTAAAGGPGSDYYFASTSGGNSSYDDYTVIADQPYSYALSTVSSEGYPGGESAAVALGTVLPFNHSALVGLSATAGDERVDLQWSPPAYGGTYGLAASPYLLYRHHTNTAPAFKALAPDPGFPVALPLTVTTWTDTSGLLNDETYFYFMSTVNARGIESSQAQFPRIASSPDSAAGMKPQGPVRPPANIIAVPGDQSVALRWIAKDTDAQRGAKFSVYRRLDSGDYGAARPELFRVGPDSGAFVNVSYVVQTLLDSKYSVDAPQNLQRYCYCMAAVNSWGEGPKSPELCVTPFMPLQPPPVPGGQMLGLSVTGKKDVQLQWQAALTQAGNGGYGVAGYRIYRSVNGGNTYELLSQTAATATSYLDINTSFGASYLYRVVPLDLGGNEGLSYSLQTAVIPASQNAVLVFKNAFNPAVGEKVAVQYSLQQPGHAWVKVFTLNGEYVATLFDEEVAAASGEAPYLSQKLDWAGTNSAGQTVASGVYFIHLEATGYRANARVAVIK